MPHLAKPALFLTLACGLAACASDATRKAASVPAAPPRGTSPSSTAEHACVAVAMSVPAAPLDISPSAPPEAPKDVADAMGEIGAAFGQLHYISANHWQVPADQPDLVPAAEAGRLTQSLRQAANVPGAQALGEDYSRFLIQSIERASALEALIAGSAPAAETQAAFKLVEASCNDCHAALLSF